ncbi:MAG: hypothetical protein E7E21_13345 [Peptostreptococcaceae bacterium]|nr:hypothetical protein [Peptostreptococcaceae bacterium]
MKNSNKKSKNPVAIIMYVLSILLGAYTIFTMYNSYTYISSLVAQGLVISDELQSVISYCVGASIPYLFYAVSFWAIGYFINKINYIISEIKNYNSEYIKDDTIITDYSEDIKEEAIITDADDIQEYEEVLIENSNGHTKEDI